MAERPTPASVFKRLTEKKPTIFYGVPTLYAAMLASPDFPKKGSLALRLCVSAGGAPPPEFARRWGGKTGGQALGGKGPSREAEIFPPQHPKDSRSRTSGEAVLGYGQRLVAGQ